MGVVRLKEASAVIKKRAKRVLVKVLGTDNISEELGKYCIFIYFNMTQTYGVHLHGEVNGTMVNRLESKQQIDADKQENENIKDIHSIAGIDRTAHISKSSANE